jgi:flagellar biosynthesis protein FlhF
MQNKVFRGKEIARVMNQIRKEHGDDAVIVSTRETERNMVEVQVQVAELLKSNVEDYSTLDQSLLQAKAVRNLEEICHSQGVSQILEKRLVQGYLSADNSNVTHHDKLLSSLSKCIPVDTRLPFKNKFVALIGSTGVGKTTTVAKLAARMHMAFEIRIGLISADYYRVGANYQLQTYANLMKLPYRSIGSTSNIKAELDAALWAFKDFDLVFIDAAGFSPDEPERINELTDLFDCNNQIERMLVLPAPGNSYDLDRSVKKFSQVGFERIIISKIDESGYCGPVLSALQTSTKPLAFLTNGQRVPEDIEPASYKRIARILQRTVH